MVTDVILVPTKGIFVWFVVLPNHPVIFFPTFMLHSVFPTNTH